MKKQTLLKTNHEIGDLILKAAHELVLARQRELQKYNILAQQAFALRLIHSLGPKATLPELAKAIERENHVVSRLTVRMESNGLIKRIKDTPKSNIVRFELTEKAIGMMNVVSQQKALNTILSFLTEEKRQQLDSILNSILIKAKKYKKG